mgnify:CR=1 FL=1
MLWIQKPLILVGTDVRSSVQKHRFAVELLKSGDCRVRLDEPIRGYKAHMSWPLSLLDRSQAVLMFDRVQFESQGRHRTLFCTPSF